MHLAQREAAADVVNSAILLCAATKSEDAKSEEKLKPVIPNTPKPQVILAACLQKYHFSDLAMYLLNILSSKALQNTRVCV